MPPDPARVQPTGWKGPEDWLDSSWLRFKRLTRVPRSSYIEAGDVGRGIPLTDSAMRAVIAVLYSTLLLGTVYTAIATREGPMGRTRPDESATTSTSTTSP
jgi:hypothetical protein